MDYSTIQEIVQILLTDEYLIRYWVRFKDALVGDDPCVVPIQERYQIGALSAFHLFWEILTYWNRREGSNASIARLTRILDEGGFRVTSETLRQTFPYEFPTGLDKSITDELIRGHLIDAGRFESVAANKLKRVEREPRAKDKVGTLTRSDNGVTKGNVIDAGRFESVADNEPQRVEREPRVKDEVWNFTGRVKELKELMDLFFGKEKYVVTITGMGGVGKSELAKHFARSLSEEHKISVMWFNGQFKEGLVDSIARLAQVVQNMPKGTNPKVGKKNLVIIDNVDEANEAADSYIKARIPDKDCFFLITSRNRKALKYSGKIIELKVLTPEDAIFLVKRCLESGPGESRESFNQDVISLCKLLDNFPLALQQAVSYINNERNTSLAGKYYKISDFVNRFNEMTEEALGHELDQLEHDYKKTTLITWQVTIDKVQKDRSVGNVATDLLHLFAYLEPDRIHIEFIEKLIAGDVKEAIKLMKLYSLINSENGFVSIHRLLQQVIRLKVFSSKDLEMQQLRKITPKILQLLVQGKAEVESIRTVFYKNENVFDESPVLICIRRGADHILSVWNYNSKHAQLIREFRTVPIHIIDVFQPFRTKHLAHITDFQNFIQKNHSLFKPASAVGPNAVETLQLEFEVALTSKQAELIDTSKLVDTFETIYKRDSLKGTEVKSRILEKMIYFLNNTGSNSHERFQKYCWDLLEISGPESATTLIPVRFMLIKSLGDTNEDVLQLYEDLLANTITAFGEEHDDTLQIMIHFGDCLFKLRKYQRTAEIFKRYLTLKQAPGDNYYVLSAKLTLSEALYYLGERNAASLIMEQLNDFWINEKQNLSQINKQCCTADKLVEGRDHLQALIKYQEIDTFFQRQITRFCYTGYFYCRFYENKSKLISCQFHSQVKTLEEASRFWRRTAGDDHDLTTTTNTQLRRGRRAIKKKIRDEDD